MKQTKIDLSFVENKRFIINTERVLLLDLEEYITDNSPNEFAGYCFSTWDKDIIHKNNFKKSSALLLDFPLFKDKTLVRDKLLEFGVYAIITDSKNTRLPKDGSLQSGFHLILPLSKEITEFNGYCELIKQVDSKLFYCRSNSFMLSADRFFFFSRKDVSIEYIPAEEEDSEKGAFKFIDELDLDQDSDLNVQTMYTRPKKNKVLRYGKKYKHFSFSNLDMNSLIYVDDIEGGLTYKYKDISAIACPFHKDSDEHIAYLKEIDNKVEILCPSFKEFFKEEEVQIDFSLDKFADRGYIVGYTGGGQILQIHSKLSGETNEYQGDGINLALNILFKSLYPLDSVTGASYFYKRYRNSRFIKNRFLPQYWKTCFSDNLHSGVNMFSDYPLKGFNPIRLTSIRNDLSKTDINKVMEKYTPSITLLIQNILGENFNQMDFQWFLNWLCGIYTHCLKSKCSVILNCHSNSGIDIFQNIVLTNLLTHSFIKEVDVSTTLKGMNDFLDKKTLLVINGISKQRQQVADTISNIRFWQSHQTIDLHRKMEKTKSMDNMCNIVWLIHGNLPKDVGINDNTFSIFRSFSDLLRVKKNGASIKSLSQFESKVQKEMTTFSQILLALRFDESMFNSPRLNLHKKALSDDVSDRTLGMLQILTDNDFSPNDIVVGKEDDTDLKVDLVTAYKASGGGFFRISLLHRLYTYIHSSPETISSRQLSSQIKQILGIEVKSKSIDGKTSKGFDRVDLEMGLRKAAGTYDYISFKKVYDPIYSEAAIKEKKRSKLFLGISQDSKIHQMIFRERPLYELQTEKQSLVSSSEFGKDTKAIIRVYAYNRKTDLLTKSEIETISPYYRIEGDIDINIYEPLYTDRNLDITQINAFLAMSEVNNITDFLFGITDLEFVSYPASSVFINCESNDDNLFNAIVIHIDSNSIERFDPDFDFKILVYSEEQFKIQDITNKSIRSLVENHRYDLARIDRFDLYR
ncbi:MAG: hypothetical protein WC155_01905 [Candidatus Cloacimonadales bacterium]